MANWIVALLLATGAGAWIYNKLLRTTGNNTRSSAIGAVVSGLLIFVLALIILGFISNAIKK